MKQIKIPLLFLSLVFVGCASSQKQPAIIFPEMTAVECSDGSERAPNALCGGRMGNPVHQEWEAVMQKFDAFTARTDASKGKGLTSAALYLPNEKQPIREKSPPTFWYPNQIVNFYQPKGLFGEVNLGGAAVLGTPTRVYLTKDGKIAYMCFDDQAITLLEYSTSHDDNTFFKIAGQGPQQHPSGFSAPVGKLKSLSEQLSHYSVDELRIFVGKEGDTVNLEFESGVVVTGVIDRYTALANSGDSNKGVVITFKDKTTTVKYGDHTLFRPAWGVYDMLLMPEVSDSNASMPVPAPK